MATSSIALGGGLSVYVVNVLSLVLEFPWLGWLAGRWTLIIWCAVNSERPVLVWVRLP